MIRWLLAAAVLVVWSDAYGQTIARVKAGTFTATVSWTCSCANQAGFNIYRRLGAASSTFTRVGTTDAKTMTFVDSGLRPNTTYVYRVSAFNEFSEVVGPPTRAATGKPPKRAKA